MHRDPIPKRHPETPVLEPRMKVRMTALIPALIALTALNVQAHDGHGMPGLSHWHADDTTLWLVGAAIAAGLWLARRGR
jgi:hypothetical protein